MALAAAAVLVAVAAGGGIGFVLLDGDGDGGGDKGASRAASASASKHPKPSASADFGVKPGGSHYGSLRKLLLPMPAGYVPGPDSGEFGYDTELTGKAARQAMKESNADLPKKQRKAARKFIESLNVRGLGVRTYREESDGRIIVEMRLIQMGRNSAKNLTAAQGEFYKALGVFRNGPRIKGFDKARCFLRPTKPGAKLDAMVCFAAEGDLMVTMNCAGVAPLQKKDAAELLRKQLERIAAPGEIV